MDPKYYDLHVELAAKLHEIKMIDHERDRLDRLDGLPVPQFRIVVTNGCFDVLHRGHIECLRWAREHGDCLVVAVNDDEGVRELKGDGRPINTLEDRLYMLRSLRCVDFAVPFHGTKATEFFKAIRADVYVKGGDYSLDGSEPGKRPLDPEEKAALMAWRPEFLFFPFRTDISTTKILEKGRASHA